MLSDEDIANGDKQIDAGKALLIKSHLLEDKNGKFSSNAEHKFEKYAKEIHPDFGRIMYWIMFSTGAEFLLKGVLRTAERK